MPVQTVTIRRQLSDGSLSEHTKPVYLCEVCGAFAHYGSPAVKNGHRVRIWHCPSHLPNSERNAAA